MLVDYVIGMCLIGNFLWYFICNGDGIYIEVVVVGCCVGDGFFIGRKMWVRFFFG